MVKWCVLFEVQADFLNIRLQRVNERILHYMKIYIHKSQICGYVTSALDTDVLNKQLSITYS